MRLLAVSALLVVVAIGTLGHAQGPQRGSILMNAVDWYRTVTMSKEGTVIAAVSVPPGTFVSVVYDKQGNPPPESVLGATIKLHGDIEVHALSRTQYDHKEKIADALLASPVTISGTDVEVALTEPDPTISR